MSTNFDYAIPLVLLHEGGYVDHPDDPGGATSFGISLRFLRAEAAIDGDIDGDGDVDVDDIRLLTVEKAKELYFKYFWSRQYDRLDRDVAYRIFDHRINAGRKSAHIIAQRAARSHGVILVEDGIFGPKTTEAISEIGPAIVASIRSERAAFYRILLARNSQFKAFAVGWLKRAYS